MQTTQQIVLLIDGICRGFKQHLTENKEKLYQLTFPQIQALHIIRRGKRVTMSELADEMHVSNPTATHLVEKLVETGWLERESDADDRRSVFLKISAEANQRLDNLMKHKIKKIEDTLSCLDNNDRIELNRILEKIHKQMEHAHDN